MTRPDTNRFFTYILWGLKFLKMFRTPMEKFLGPPLGEKQIRVALVRLGWETRFYRLFHCRNFGRVEVGFPHI
ncbi:hypothetical protein Hdeb2414_s0013g00412011 [Helianthus debilis subsp. tardiflorus]